MITTLVMLAVLNQSPVAEYARISRAAASPASERELHDLTVGRVNNLIRSLDEKDVEQTHKKLESKVKSMTVQNQRKLALVILAKLPEIKTRYERAGATKKVMTFVEDEFVDNELHKMFPRMK
jgi:hypothetical protein